MILKPTGIAAASKETNEENNRRLIAVANHFTAKKTKTLLHDNTEIAFTAVTILTCTILIGLNILIFSFMIHSFW